MKKIAILFSIMLTAVGALAQANSAETLTLGFTANYAIKVGAP